MIFYLPFKISCNDWCIVLINVYMQWKMNKLYFIWWQESLNIAWGRKRYVCVSLAIGYWLRQNSNTKILFDVYIRSEKKVGWAVCADIWAWWTMKEWSALKTNLQLHKSRRELDFKKSAQNPKVLELWRRWKHLRFFLRI